MRVEAGDYFFGMCVKPSAIPAQDMQKQQLGGERVRGHIRVAKFGDASFQRRANVDVLLDLRRLDAMSMTVKN